jgi:hypothetical protein
MAMSLGSGSDRSATKSYPAQALFAPETRLGLTEEELWEKARREELIAYRARVADHWEWRISPADVT